MRKSATLPIVILFVATQVSCATSGAAMGTVAAVGQAVVSIAPAVIGGVTDIISAVKKDASDTTDATMEAVGFGGEETSTEDGT